MEENDDTQGFLTGVIEGFYGQPWTSGQREQLFQNMAEDGLQLYMYAPKDDSKHRLNWHMLYDSSEQDALRSLIVSATRQGVEFVYAIAPGLDIRYSSEQDMGYLLAKLEQVAHLGCESFAILFDDIESTMNDEDRLQFESFAHAHVSLTNRVVAYLGDRATRVLFCPTEYCGTFAVPSVAESQYLHTVDVVPPFISAKDISEVGRVIQRKPLIWDNFHANDYDSKRVFLGPFDCRSPGLRDVTCGLLSNPNCEFTANHIPLQTLGMWALSREDYDSRDALNQAAVSWHSTFGGSVSLASAHLLVDAYFLPFEYGPRTKALLEDLQWLLCHAANSSTWTVKHEDVIQYVDDFNDLFAEFVTIENSDVLCELFCYVWDAKKHLNHAVGELKRIAANSNIPELSHMDTEVLDGFTGGLVGALKRLVPPRDDRNSRRNSPDLQNLMIREAGTDDAPAIRCVCLETGDAGRDATPLYPAVPDALGDRWAAPYVTLKDTLAFVLEDSEGTCGYVLSALDSRSFYKELQEEYLPNARQKYPETVEGLSQHEAAILSELSTPTVFLPPALESQYPAHLHIDLVARAQGQGLGRKMMETMLEELQQHNVAGVHLEMHPTNYRALAFYLKLGFTKCEVQPDHQALILVKRFVPRDGTKSKRS